MDEVASSLQESVIDIGEIPRHLFHPFSIGLLDNSSDLDSTSLEVDDEEHEVANQAYPCQHLDAEEVRCRDGSPMRLQEGLPGHRSSAKRSRIQPIIKENSLDCISPDLVAQIVECSSDSRVTPRRILTGHLQDQLLDLRAEPDSTFLVKGCEMEIQAMLDLISLVDGLISDREYALVAQES